jgi:hypothetical protein
LHSSGWSRQHGCRVRIEADSETAYRGEKLLGNLVYGKLIVDPQERTLADFVRAATATDVRQYSFRFRSSQLPKAATEFECLLRPFMAAERQLPIPSSGNEHNELPRPSHPPAPGASELPMPDGGGTSN